MFTKKKISKASHIPFKKPGSTGTPGLGLQDKPAPGILTLPVELQIQIISFLGLIDLISASLISAIWHSICSSEIQKTGYQNFQAYGKESSLRIHKWLLDDTVHCNGCSICVSKQECNKGYYPTLASATSKSMYLIGNLDPSNTRIVSYERWIEKCSPSPPSSRFNVEGFHRINIPASALESQLVFSPAGPSPPKIDSLTFPLRYKARLTNSTSTVPAWPAPRLRVPVSLNLRQFIDQSWEKMYMSLCETADQYITKVHRIRFSVEGVSDEGLPVVQLDVDGEGGRIVDMYGMQACGNARNHEITSRQRASSVFRRQYAKKYGN